MGISIQATYALAHFSRADQVQNAAILKQAHELLVEIGPLTTAEAQQYEWTVLSSWHWVSESNVKANLYLLKTDSTAHISFDY